ncbi:phenoloxidase subunit 1 [Culex quinquefasciatus]|uniref:Phenoloxidase subunit 1 n=1 Tax=Culex quinquefasciatus TaxID=7176 RepID=B0WEE6_CULQU|nr:phenoloxidase subunit 1 [Culex quinquefasciatus]|eukprot:XP_001847080.1 phenoloxidase subunit 1 [Culex quinquefasciatus]
MTSSNDVLALLQRPLEPTFYPKDDGKTVLELPDSYLTDRYRPIGQELQSRFGDNVDVKIPVRDVRQPDIGFALAIPRRAAFSLFIQRHREIASRLIDIFLKLPDISTLIGVGSYVRDRVNVYLFQYAFTVAVQHRPDTTNVNLPSILQLFPDQFVDPSVFPKLREEGKVVTQKDRQVIDIPMNFTASDREDEQRLAYFREDIGVNMHHWHWHLVYPTSGPIEVIDKDRRGELFFYMHQQIIHRYNVERFCNLLGRTKSMHNFREPIPEAYFPKMVRSADARPFAARPQNFTLKDIDRDAEGFKFTISEMEQARDRIYAAIDAGFVEDKSGKRIPLDPKKGIDILSNLVEASDLSINPQLYGNLHIWGHLALSFCHDPENRYLEQFGIMGDLATAQRDPTFYRWHSFVDDVLVRHKDHLDPYTAQELSFPGITVSGLNVTITRKNAPPNVLLTYWQKSQVDLAAGLDFGPGGNVFASFTHLQHAPFVYNIDVNNSTSRPARGTVRIFIAPKADDRNLALKYDEWRRYVIELDKFAVSLNPGLNKLTRRSDQSTVTVAYNRTFRQIKTAQDIPNKDDLERFRFCGCGWPDHMLLPKGTTQGMAFDLFVMVSDYAGDSIGLEFDEAVNCNDSHSFCGLRDKMYPDNRSMGYPFDRKSPASVQTLQDYLGPNSNMRATDVKIKFTNTVIART